MAWRGRRRTDGDPAADIRAAIVAITTARDLAGRNAAAALVNQAQAGRALSSQRRELQRSLADVDAAVTAARRVAEDARATDGAAAAEPYLRHLDGLHSQRQVLESAVAQIDALAGVADDQLDQARRLLVSSRRELNDALHEQLRLLVAVEHLERARAVAAARVERRSGTDRPGRPEHPTQ